MNRRPELIAVTYTFMTFGDGFVRGEWWKCDKNDLQLDARVYLYRNWYNYFPNKRYM